MESGLISTKLKSVVTLVNKLRDLQLEAYIKLPKIVAVGSQSSGKSSLVEQIVGIDFLPRGSVNFVFIKGVVTRRPLEIRMVYDESAKKPYAKFEEIPGIMTDFNKVREGIENVTEKICGNKKNIIDKPIILDVHSSSCPNLTIIDLPGLTRIPIDGQDKNIHEVTRNMILKYIQEPSTIILCVIPANQDITNDEVLHLARKIDVKGERTIGCITKIDIMDRGTDARNLLSNKGEVPLKLGYVGIKNRSQADINQKLTVQESIENEKMFFSKSPIYSSLPSECLGTTSLVSKMTQVLTDNISNYLPNLISEIKSRKAKLNEIVKSYGRPLPKNQYEKQSLLWEISSLFLNEYKKCLAGQISVLKCHENLLKTSSHIQVELQKCLQEEFLLNPRQTLSDKDIELSLRKFEGSNMPGFPSISAFLYLLHPLLNSLKLPIEESLNHIYDEIMHIVDLISKEVAFGYGQLGDYITEKVQSILNKHRRNCREFFENIMQAELNYIYTNNPDYDKYLNQEMEENQKKEKNTQMKNPMISILRKRIDAYYRVVIKNLRDLVPKNVKYSLLVEATKTIEFEMFQIISQEQKIEEFFKIDDSTKNERIKIEREYETLCKAEEFLITHSAISGYKNTRDKNRIIMRQQEIEETNRKRLEKEKNKIEGRKNIEEKKEKIVTSQEEKPTPEKKEEKKEGGFFDFFTKKPNPTPEKKEDLKKESLINSTAASTSNNTPISGSQNGQQVKQTEKKQSSFEDIFGINSKKNTTPVQQQPLPAQSGNNQPLNKQTLAQTYNTQVSKATDSAVDSLYANEQFKQKSKQAVTEGTSVAAQKQLGVSKETGNMLGKGAGWLFGQDVTQNYLKEETKKNIKNQAQYPSK